MNKEIDCAVVKDLLPNYIDKLTSTETNQILENHFSSCTDCVKERDEMMGVLKLDTAPKQPNLGVFLNKTKKMYLLKGITLSIGIIAILVSFIVDIAMNRKLTWSLIVDASIAYIYIGAMTAILVKKNKIIYTTLASSILILPLLYIIEYVVNKNYLLNPIHWFQIYALPITGIWLAIIWIVIMIKKFMKTNIWSALGVLLLLTMLGSSFTNAIASQISVSEVYETGFEWINSLSYFGCALICFIVGYIRRGKGRF